MRSSVALWIISLTSGCAARKMRKILPMRTKRLLFATERRLESRQLIPGSRPSQAAAELAASQSSVADKNLTSYITQTPKVWQMPHPIGEAAHAECPRD